MKVQTDNAHTQNKLKNLYLIKQKIFSVYTTQNAEVDADSHYQKGTPNIYEHLN